MSYVFGTVGRNKNFCFVSYSFKIINIREGEPVGQMTRPDGVMQTRKKKQEHEEDVDDFLIGVNFHLSICLWSRGQELSSGSFPSTYVTQITKDIANPAQRNVAACPGTKLPRTYRGRKGIFSSTAVYFALSRTMALKAENC